MPAPADRSALSAFGKPRQRFGIDMTMPVKQKVFYSLILTAVALLIVIPDVVFEVLFEIGHALFEIIVESVHATVEAIELMLDHVVETTFETGLKTTQTIVFYIMFVMGAGVIYALAKVLLKVLIYGKNKLFALWVEQQYLISVYWLNLSLSNKIKLITLMSGIAYLFFIVSF